MPPSRKRPATAPATEAASTKAAKVEIQKWVVKRLAAKSEKERKWEGGDFKAKQSKVSCATMTINTAGVVGHAKGKLFGFGYDIKDFNNYRTQGHTGRFEAGSLDRAVSVATVAAYDALREALGPEQGRLVKDGDLGENITLDGPSATSSKKKTGDGLFVGQKLKIGAATIQITEANNPCYRCNTLPWAAAGKALWGATAPEGNAEKWFKSPKCLLFNETFPGIRGYLAKVLVEGKVAVGDPAANCA